jgi:hypothetical protein
MKMKDERDFREIQKVLQLVGIKARKVQYRQYLRVRVPDHPQYVLSVANLGDGWFVEVDQPGMLADDYQAVQEDVAAFRERIRISIESSLVDEESPVEESTAGENAESDSAGQQFSESLSGEDDGKECPKCNGKGHLSEKEYWDQEGQSYYPEDEDSWCRECYGSGLANPPKRLIEMVEDCLSRRATKVADELGFEYLLHEGEHIIRRENFLESYSTAEGAIEGMREFILIRAEKHLLKTTIDSLCYEMAMSKLPANNICVSVTGNTIEECSLDDLKIFLNHLRYIEKVALGPHAEYTCHTS